MYPSVGHYGYVACRRSSCCSVLTKQLPRLLGLSKLCRSVLSSQLISNPLSLTLFLYRCYSRLRMIWPHCCNNTMLVSLPFSTSMHQCAPNHSNCVLLFRGTTIRFGIFMRLRDELSGRGDWERKLHSVMLTGRLSSSFMSGTVTVMKITTWPWRIRERSMSAKLWLTVATTKRNCSVWLTTSRQKSGSFVAGALVQRWACGSLPRLFLWQSSCNWHCFFFFSSVSVRILLIARNPSALMAICQLLLFC